MWKISWRFHLSQFLIEVWRACHCWCVCLLMVHITVLNKPRQVHWIISITSNRCSSTVPLLSVPLHTTTFSGKAFRCTATTTLSPPLQNYWYPGMLLYVSCTVQRLFLAFYRYTCDFIELLMFTNVHFQQWYICYHVTKTTAVTTWIYLPNIVIVADTLESFKCGSQNHMFNPDV